MQTPLEGIRVLDFTRVLAGPHCTRMLADLGADVIKVEPPAGDLTRFASPRRHSMSSYFVQQNVGKRCVSIDLARREGAEIAFDLADRSDVLVENYRPGVMDRFGLGYDAIAGRNPRIVYASISGYGATGSWRDRRAYAPVVQAELGFTKSQGDHGGGGLYRNDRHSHADAYTAIDAAAAILAALYQREHTGRGQWIDVSMGQVMMYVNEHVHDELWDGEVDPDWVRSFGTAYHPVVTLADGSQAIIGGHPAENGTFHMYAKAIDRPELVDDPRYATPAMRQQHLDRLLGAIRSYAATVPDVDALEARFSRFGLAVGVIRSVADVCASDWALERDAVAEVDDRGGATLRIPNAPWRFSDAPGVGVSGSPRYRGEDNAEVLHELLGYDDDRIAALVDAGVLSEHRPTRT